jgi:hypothetical protein
MVSPGHWQAELKPGSADAFPVRTAVKPAVCSPRLRTRLSGAGLYYYCFESLSCVRQRRGRVLVSHTQAASPATGRPTGAPGGSFILIDRCNLESSLAST